MSTFSIDADDQFGYRLMSPSGDVLQRLPKSSSRLTLVLRPARTTDRLVILDCITPPSSWSVVALAARCLLSRGLFCAVEADFPPRLKIKPTDWRGQKNPQASALPAAAMENGKSRPGVGVYGSVRAAVLVDSH